MTAVIMAMVCAVSGCSRGKVAAPAPKHKKPDQKASQELAASKPPNPPKEPTPAAADSPPADSQPSADDLSSERAILFLPDSPLVIELRMTIDGKPFRAAREKLVDDALALAHSDSDGQASWDEIMSDPKRAFAKRFALTFNAANHREFIKANDTNQNGLLDRDEARRIVARANGAGAAFTLENSGERRRSNQRLSIVRTMLDANEDDLLDVAELDRAEQRLSARDANDDRILTWSELDDSLAGDEQAMSSRKNAYLNHPAALVLGGEANWDGIVYTLSELYLSGGRSLDEAFARTPSLAADLDLDRDGELSYEEVRRLDVATPQAAVAVNFGQPGELAAGASLLSLSPDLGPADRIVSHTPRGLLLALDGCRVQIVLDDRVPAGDNKPASEEQMAMFSAIRAVASNEVDSLFPLLDADQDGRLTTRELRAARQALAPLDADGDGCISLEELPGGLTLWLGRGLPSGMSPRRSVLAASAPATPSGPAWFVAMDVNRDQEISLEEFPGRREKFRSLDLDGDGFVSSSEALATAQ